MTPPDARPLAGQAWLRDAATRRVLDALEADGRPARFVGGCVRDGLLGVAGDEADLDIATAEPPERVLELLGAAGIRAIPTGLEHGTVTAVLDDRRFEITTLRRDLRTDGRHAEVAFAESFEEDAARRDFTINALSADRTGRLFDYAGGREDLARGRVRFVGEPARRIAEDHLRILRFFRFYARFGRPPPDPDAVWACRAKAQTIRRLSGERIQSEMIRLLAAPGASASLELMVETGVAAEVFLGPVGLGRLKGLLDLRPDAGPLLRLAALLRPPPATADAAVRVAERWRLARDDQRRLGAAVGPAVALPATAVERRRLLYRLGAARATDLASLEAAEHGEPARAALEALLDDAARFVPPSLPVTGDDVLAAGVAPGPAIGRVLHAVEDWWVERDFVPDRDACLARLEAVVAATPADARTEP